MVHTHTQATAFYYIRVSFAICRWNVRHQAQHTPAISAAKYQIT